MVDGDQAEDLQAGTGVRRGFDLVVAVEKEVDESPVDKALFGRVCDSALPNVQDAERDTGWPGGSCSCWACPLTRALSFQDGGTMGTTNSNRRSSDRKSVV